MNMRPYNNTMMNVQEACLHNLEPLPFLVYTSSKQRWAVTLKSPTSFTSGGRPGVPLRPTPAEAAQGIDGRDDAVFDGCGSKVSWVIQIPGWKSFKTQKHAYTCPGGKRVPNTRAKVVQQAAEVMAAFIAQKAPDAASAAYGPPVQFGDGGIKLEDLVILELRHVAKSSFQPIFALKCNCPPVPVIVPQSPYDMWLEDTYHQGDEFFYGNTLGDPGTGLGPMDAQPYALVGALGPEDELMMLIQAFNNTFMDG